MKYPMYIVDAFTIGKSPFTGNAAAVVLLNFDDEISDETKQKIASEMNLSETVFIANDWIAPKVGGSESKSLLKKTIRWFTPKFEIPLCGHATLASGLVLFELYKNSKDKISESETTIEFETKFRGRVSATIKWENNLITINFPSNPPRPLLPEEFLWLKTPEIVEKVILGPKLSFDAIQEIQYSPGLKAIVIRLKDSKEKGEDILKSVSPNFEVLKTYLDVENGRFLTVTTRGSGKRDEPDFYLRFFAPLDFINEDPVTGSLSTVTVPYWNKIFEKNSGDGDEYLERGPTLWVRQSSERGGDLFCSLVEEKTRVNISGFGTLFLKGEFNL